jgi:hypothetical protein
MNPASRDDVEKISEVRRQRFRVGIEVDKDKLTAEGQNRNWRKYQLPAERVSAAFHGARDEPTGAKS